MKPYFAKYLPVEGDIKEGDYTLWPEYDDGLMAGRILKTSATNITHLSALNCKPYKFFLCSRDIKVGDKVIADYWIDKGGKYETHIQKEGEAIDPKEDIQDHIELKMEDNFYSSGYAREFALRSGCFKVIGEISPEATWVKEGDEFERKQVQGMSLDNTIIFEDDFHCKLEWIEYIRIKGSCGHFH